MTPSTKHVVTALYVMAARHHGPSPTPDDRLRAMAELPPQRVVEGVNDQPAVRALLEGTCGVRR